MINNHLRSFRTGVFFVFLLALTAVSLSAQNPVANQAKDLYRAGDYTELSQYVAKQLDGGKLDNYTRFLLRYLQTRCFQNEGDIKNAFDLSVALYDEYQGTESDDTLMNEAFLNLCRNLSYLSIDAGYIQKGIEAVNEGLRVCEEKLDDRLKRYVSFCYNASSLYRSVDSFDLAMEFIDKGYDKLGKIDTKEKRELYGMVKNEEAILYMVTNESEKGMAVFEELLEMAEADENPELETRFNINLGLTHQMLDDFVLAEHYLRRAIKSNALKEYEHDLDEYIINANLSGVYVGLQQYSQAEEALLNSINAAKKIYGPESPRVAGLYKFMGETSTAANDLAQAEEFHRQNVEILASNYDETNLFYTDNLSDYGGAMIRNGNVAEGKQLVLQAIANRKKEKQKQDRALANGYSLLTEAALQEGDLTAAAESLAKAFATLDFDLEDYNGSFQKIANPNLLVHPFRLLFEMLQQKSLIGEKISAEANQADLQFEKLVAHLRKYSSDVTTRKLLAKEIQPVRDRQIALHFAMFDQTSNKDYLTAAFDVMERSKNVFLYENIQEKAGIKNAITQRLYDRRKALLTSIDRAKQELVSTSEEGPVWDSLNTVHVSTNEELFALMDTIKTQFPDYYAYVYDFDYTSLPKVEQRLDEEEVLLNFHETGDELFCIISTSDKSSFVKVKDWPMLREKISKFIAEQGNPQGELIFGGDIYRELLGSAGQLGSKLFIVPDGLLNGLSFAVLQNPDTDRFLIEEMSLAIEYSSSFLVQQKTKSSNGNGGLLAMAPGFMEAPQPEDAKQQVLYASLMRGGVSPLPSSADEVNTIGAYFDGEVFVGAQATVDNFKQHAERVSILHLATHGITDEANPTASSLLLSSIDNATERITAAEIANMTIDAELVTLSACNTGTGGIVTGEGVYSLGRAFSYAGAKNQVLSLWSVNDASTTQLMASFYKNLKDGDAKPEALRKAQTEYLASAPKALQHPYYWGAFVYFGDDQPLDVSNGNSKWIYLAGAGILLLGLWYIFSSKRRLKL